MFRTVKMHAGPFWGIYLFWSMHLVVFTEEDEKCSTCKCLQLEFLVSVISHLCRSVVTVFILHRLKLLVYFLFLFCSFATWSLNSLHLISWHTWNISFTFHSPLVCDNGGFISRTLLMDFMATKWGRGSQTLTITDPVNVE